MKFEVQGRKLQEVCTDPQRRCYDGVFASSEMHWSEWKTIYTATSKDDAESSVATYKRINGSHREYRVVPLAGGESGSSPLPERSSPPATFVQGSGQ
jgi:hypothetical protein